MLRRLVCATVLAMLPLVARAAQPVPVFPTPPRLPRPRMQGYVRVGHVKIWYGSFGSGPPVVLLEGGLDTSDDWGYLAPALAARGYRAIVMDTRCQGRSTCSKRLLTYRLIAHDTRVVLAALHVRRAAFVGYSDGGIVALELAVHGSPLVSSVFAYGANSNPGALVTTAPTKQEAAVNRASEVWSAGVYHSESPTPNGFKAIDARLNELWNTRPHLTADELRSIAVPVWIVDGDRDGIKRSDTDFMARTIPQGKELILPGATHYALWQYRRFFNAAVLQFLRDP